MQNPIERKPHVIFRLSGYGIAWYTLPLPTVAFIICVVLSLIFNFEASTATHCRVPNYLPSISAAIGGFVPQRYIWRICIALHVAPRLMVALAYHSYYALYTSVYNSSSLYRVFIGIATFLHIMENMCLLGLTYVSSTENYQIHEKSFIGFMTFSILYMFLTVVLYKWSHRDVGFTFKEKRTYWWKLRLAVFNLSIFLIGIYFFLRHNKYCEPGVYTIYAACEYVIVLSNIAFHATDAINFGEGALSYTTKAHAKVN